VACVRPQRPIEQGRATPRERPATAITLPVTPRPPQSYDAGSVIRVFGTHTDEAVRHRDRARWNRVGAEYSVRGLSLEPSATFGELYAPEQNDFLCASPFWFHARARIPDDAEFGKA
jgi:hypothetical protein